MIFRPGPFNIGDKGFRNGELAVEIIIHHVLYGSQAKVPQFGRSFFYEEDLLYFKFITGAFVPVRHVRGMESET